MKQIIYCSRAKPSVTFEDIKLILEVANTKNKEFALSGMLLYNGTYFLQCIEGEEGNIEKLYSNILQDERHNEIEKIGFVNIEKRDFAKWAMGYYNSKTKVNGLIEYDDFDPYILKYEEAKSLLIKFSKGIA